MNAAKKAVNHLQIVSEKKNERPIIIINQASNATLVEERINK